MRFIYSSTASTGSRVPDPVVALVFQQGMTPAQAWRTHLGLALDAVAARLGLSPPDYEQLELSMWLARSMRARLAQVLGIEAGQLDF
ncbi:helix-turn-helix domain-containing protein [Roseateles amylovorans]|jgi:hypothetical protein|uniref:Helix-turn-helix domain-containing protein n=1 Tax=Roseateles amylovorans TaxID=2978473 RepID=A0ABY6BA32_9BURK|nr:helix-turn-helix domain-containing protein [Roseateles amylovorans]UXH80092.1 helix-turn-helix domain-containing protein [Roseateles amylovorans]